MIIGNENFPINYEGQGCIICGSAPCLPEEFDYVRQYLKDYVVIAVNEAVGHVNAEHLMSLHFDRMRFFKNLSKNKSIITHSCKMGTFRNDVGVYEKDIDYWWKDCQTSGTSTMGAILVANKMGFSKIVLVGAPMNGGDGYYNSTVRAKKGETRFGYSKGGVVKAHQSGVLHDLQKYPILKEKVRSMSGWTSEVFGKWQAI